MMEVESIDIYNLRNVSYLSTIRCLDFSEAASVCLDSHGHESGKILSIEGDLDGDFRLIWSKVTQRMKDTRNDMSDTVESGAYCIAMLVIERMKNLRVTKQSQRRTGFDYWLGDEDSIGMQGMVRLEVSGILKGNTGQINQRLKEKMEQTKKSDNLSLPAYVVVVEFGYPKVKTKKR